MGYNIIPKAAITAWRKHIPWVGNDQVEHDLILSRALCELYQHSLIREQLAFRGGTALHKLFFESAGRFSEDLDFVQVTAQPIGLLVAAIRDRLDHWLGKPSWKTNQGRFTLNYRFETEFSPVVQRKVKIEINTREHFSVEGPLNKRFNVQNTWFTGQADILTYTIEELLGTKLRALYQRKKGRDLYDLWYAIQSLPTLNISKIIDSFKNYMRFVSEEISRAEFEQNLSLKSIDMVFNNDIFPLLSADQTEQYHIKEAYHIIHNNLITQLIGNPWKGKL